ncbi:hypothetical protein Back2_18880 [Nocardioides baekrokdamisoli]|uniref:YCII-related domain-containing protein n=1 Tax=Nocardioides baekrokdamisoli TaxID=1804624 RepID=A0A3G9IVA1_9ACTN|nr:YciI family protein [Nocardioides baekrokdamisoli]BBH17601.1 hypothetical protein Back2_18880 [Nocardioides baekrokdamisoli]
MTQYLLSVYDRPGDRERPLETMQPLFEAVDRFNAKLQAEGHWVFAGGLADQSTATVVEAKGGDVVVTDGPFLETKEYLGGFWIIEAADLDVALGLAKEGAIACTNPVEVRPFMAEDELPVE